MATLSKVIFDKRTTFLDPKEEMYVMHMLQGDRLIGDYIRSQMRLNPHMRRDIFHQPICERCEKFGFHHKEGVMCATCGHWSPTKTHKVKDHIKGGHYK